MQNLTTNTHIGFQSQPPYLDNSVAGPTKSEDISWDDWSDYVNKNYASAVQAEREWSEKQAQKQMDFQERMSSTAYQRAMQDLQAAGLNPILAATKGAAASTPSGSMGTTSAQQVYSENDKLKMTIEIMKAVVSVVNSAMSSAAKAMPK